MAVYVDNMFATCRHMKMCHMIADTSQELIQMADKIGVKRKWIQKEGTYQEHFDICTSKRLLALENGAVEITMRELAIKTINKKTGE
jgi:hypothetical protein